ncbi:hypothetical protein ABK040_006311 [Willaertia magna]
MSKIKEKQDRANWISQYKALKSKSESCKKDVQMLLFNNHRLSDMKECFSDILNAEGINLQEQAEMRKENFENKNEIKGRVNILKKLTVEAKEKQTNEQEKDETIRRLQTMMERIENAVIVFKQTHRQRLQTLNTEEKLIMKEISTFEGKIDNPNWLKENDEPETVFDDLEKMQAIRKYVEKREKELNVPQEVIDFDNFVASNGGVFGGWDEVDHNVFLQLRRQYRKQDEILFITKVVEQIYGKTLIDIQDHERFYKQFLSLQEQKKNAIKKWREEREKRKEEQLEIEERDKLRKIEEEEERKKVQLKKEKELMKIRLNQWKEEKDKHLEKKEQIKKQEEEEIKQRQFKEEQLRRQKIKEQLESYKLIKEQKKAEKQQQLIEELNKKTRPPSPISFSRAKEREEKLLLKKLQKKTQKEIEEEEKMQRLQKLKEKVRIEVSADSSRLLKPTQAQIERESKIRQELEEAKENNNQSNDRLNFDVRRIQHRIIPSWKRL